MKRIAVIALDGAYTSSLCELLDIAHIANLYISNRLGGSTADPKLNGGIPALIQWQVLSIDGRPPQGAVGLPVAVEQSIGDAPEPFDMVFVPALDFPDEAVFLARLADFAPLYPWLRQQWQAGAVIASLCTGTFVLAEAGLLDNRVATSNRWTEPLFHQRYPAVRLDTAQEITEQDRIVCGATLSQNLRLSLRVLERFLASDIFNLTAKSVFSSARRDVLPPGVLPPGNEETPLNVDDDLVAQAQYWFQRNLSQKIRLADIAASMLVSEKTLVRHFKQTLGMTPHEYLQGVRIDSAKTMLLNSDFDIEKIAERVGYGDVSFFKQVFRRHVGMTPASYRKNGAQRPLAAGVDKG